MSSQHEETVHFDIGNNFGKHFITCILQMYFDVFGRFLVLAKVLPNVYQVVYHVLKAVVQTYLRSRNVKDYIRTVSYSKYNL